MISNQAARAVHRSLSAVVTTNGSDAPRELYAAFAQFNAEHFGGKLGAPFVFIGACSSPRSLGDYIGQDVHGIESRIRISERAVGRGLDFARWVLLHEMVHAWQSEIDGNPEHGYRGHGPSFAAKCNEIGEKLGFARVGVKGRDGLPDCARWPMNVLPDAMRPAPPEPKKDEKPAKKKRAAGDGDSGGDGQSVSELLAEIERLTKENAKLRRQLEKKTAA